MLAVSQCITTHSTTPVHEKKNGAAKQPMCMKANQPSTGQDKLPQRRFSLENARRNKSSRISVAVDAVAVDAVEELIAEDGSATVVAVSVFGSDIVRLMNGLVAV